MLVSLCCSPMTTWQWSALKCSDLHTAADRRSLRREAGAASPARLLLLPSDVTCWEAQAALLASELHGATVVTFNGGRLA